MQSCSRKAMRCALARSLPAYERRAHQWGLASERRSGVSNNEFQSFADYHDVGIQVWSPLAGGFLSGKYSRTNPAPAGTRYAEAGTFVPFDKEIGYRVVEMLKEVAARHGASPARVALSWVLGRPAVSSATVPNRWLP